MTDQDAPFHPGSRAKSPPGEYQRCRVGDGSTTTGCPSPHHYTGSLAGVPSRPTMFTGQYPDVHGLTQTDGLGKDPDDSGMR